MIKNIINIVDKVTDWVKNRPQRLREQALDAAESYIELNEYSSHKGQVVSQEDVPKWMEHYKKQFYAWRDGS